MVLFEKKKLLKVRLFVFILVSIITISIFTTLCSINVNAFKIHEEKDFYSFSSISLALPRAIYVEDKPDSTVPLEGVVMISFLEDECIPTSLQLEVYLQEKGSLITKEEYLGILNWVQKAESYGFKEKISATHLDSLELYSSYPTKCFSSRADYSYGTTIRFLAEFKFNHEQLQGLDYSGLFGSSNLQDQIAGAIRDSLADQGVLGAGSGTGGFGGSSFSESQDSFVLELQVNAYKPISYNPYPYPLEAIKISVIPDSVYTMEQEPLPDDTIIIDTQGKVIRITTKYGMEEEDIQTEFDRLVLPLEDLGKSFSDKDIGKEYDLIIIGDFEDKRFEIERKTFSVEFAEPKTILFEPRECIPKWDCGPWSSCQLKFNFPGFIQRNIPKYYIPIQQLICRQSCTNKKITMTKECQSRKTFFLTPIEELIEGNKFKFIEVYDSKLGLLKARIKFFPEELAIQESKTIDVNLGNLQ